MKRYLRYLALLLCICIVTASLSTCMALFRVYSELEQMVGDALEDADGSDAGNPSQDGEKLPLEYTLTDADRAEFDRLLEICRTLTLQGADGTAIDEAWETLEDHYYHIATQAQIAYILYCWDQNDKSLSDAYLYASEMSSDVYADYMALCQEIDASNSPYRDEFFSDWTEEEIEEMRSYSDSLSELYDANDRILVEFRELGDEEFDNRAAELYYQTVLNNNRIASLKGYENYYVYAYDKIYMRDYSAEDTAELHELGATLLVPYFKRVSAIFQANYKNLNSVEQSFLSALLYADYDSLAHNYVKDYIDAAPESMKASMVSMFLPENSLFTDNESSYEGAFTGILYEYEKPFCYFGPGYQSSDTVIHELGHYYAEQFHIDDALAMDLAEVHSQGNEMLFWVYLKDQISENVYKTLVSYLLLDALSTVIMCLVIDRFEMLVYQNSDQIKNPATRLDALMDEVVDLFGGRAFLTENIGDPFRYWRRVTIESPVYYISYAVSGIAAIELYAVADEDYNAAMGAYRTLVEEATPSDGFLAALQKAGLGNPLKRETIEKLRPIFERR